MRRVNEARGLGSCVIIIGQFRPGTSQQSDPLPPKYNNIMTHQTDQEAIESCKFTPLSPIALPLAIVPNQHPDVIYKSHAIMQPFKFEVFCPLSCQGIKIGVYNYKEKSDTRAVEFRTTTNRTVQTHVNSDIVYSVNHHKPQNKEKKKTDDPSSYGIALKVDHKGNLAVVNPFYLSSNPLDLYTLHPIAVSQPRQNFVFGPMELNSQYIQVAERRVYYRNNRIAYRPYFKVPNSRDSTILLQDPDNSAHYLEGKLAHLKANIDSNLSYLLQQLSSYVELYTSKLVTTDNLDNIDEVYTKLGYWLNLDEQVRCQLLDHKNEKLFSELYPNYSRLYTAFFRLSSFLNYGNSRYDVIQLAELGFYNQSDLLQNLAHYEDPHVPISNIEEGPFLSESQLLRKRLPHLRSLNNLPFPNVPLEVSLTSLPAQTHDGGDISKVVTSGNFFGLVSTDKVFSLWTSEVLLLNLISFDLKSFVKRNQAKVEVTEEIKTATNASMMIHPCEQLSDLFVDESVNKPKEPEEEVIVPDPDKLEQLVLMGFPQELCKKALIAVKNESIQAVLDCIDQIKQEEDEKRKTKLTIKKLRLKEGWTCSTCTFYNPCSSSDVCDVCQSTAPITEYIEEEDLEKQAFLKKEEEAKTLEQESKKKREKEHEQKQKEEEQKRRAEDEAALNEKQEEAKLENFILKADLTDIKLVYLDSHSLDPFFVLCLLKGSDRSLLRVFRVGLKRSYLENFIRREQDSFVSTFNQSIRPQTFESFSLIVQEARRSVHWGRAFFESTCNWNVIETRDLFIQEQVTSFDCKEMKGGISIILNGDKSLYADINIKDNKEEVSFDLKRCDVHSEERNIIKSDPIKPQPVDNTTIRCTKVSSTEVFEVRVPAEHSYFELQVTEHLSKGAFTYREVTTSERKQEEPQDLILRNFLPLRLENFSGSVSSDKVSPAALFHPVQLYNSNYPLTYFVFRSVEDKPILAETVAIISESKVSNSGSPVTSGLIFTCDEPAWFYAGKQKFQYYTREDYNDWVSKRGNDEPRYWEPVGFFEIREKDKSVEFELDFKRPAKYICLLPTGVMKGKFDLAEASVVINFFGVKGRVINKSKASSLKPSPSREVKAQGSFREMIKLYNSEEKQQIGEAEVDITQRSQINGISFFVNEIDAASLKELETSVTTFIVVKLKKIRNDPVIIKYTGSGKLINFKLLHSISARESSITQLNSNSENYSTELYESIVVNPFLSHDLIQGLDLGKFIRTNILAEKSQLYEAEKLISIFRHNKDFEKRLLHDVCEIITTLNQENVKVTSQGLKYFLRLFAELSPEDRPLVIDTVLRVWESIVEYTRKTRNPNYRVLRNKYDIKELILQKRLFSEFYHNLISPNVSGALPEAPTTDTFLPPNAVSTFIHRTNTTSNTIMYVRFVEKQSINSIRLYFQKTSNKLKLRFKIFKVDRLGDRSFRKNLVYHRWWNEDLMHQMGHLAFTPETEIYQSKHNFLEIGNLDVKGEFWIFEVNYNLVGAFFKNKKDSKTENSLVMPVFLASETDSKDWSDPNGIVEEDDFETLFSLKAEESNYNDAPKVEGLWQFKQTQESSLWVTPNREAQLQMEAESTNTVGDEIIANILNKELVMSKKNEVNFKGCYGEKGLDFSYSILIMLNRFISSSFVKEELKSRGRELTEVLLKLYDTFVVYEIGPVCDNMMSLIVELLEVVDKVELQRFVCRVVESYLVDVESLRNKAITEEYQIKHVLYTLEKIKEIPIIQVLEMINDSSSKLAKITVLQLVEHSLTHQTYKLSLYDLESGQLIRESSLKEVLERLFLLGLGLIKSDSFRSQSNLQISLLNLCLDTILLVFDNLSENPAELKLVTDQFLTQHSQQNLWILIFNALGLPDEKLRQQINLLIKHLIANANKVFNESINKMIYEIVNKNPLSLYRKISGEVSNEIWMKHLQSVLEFLIKSQEGSKDKFVLNYEIAESLLQLPLTTALWSLALSILPKDERILLTLIKQLTPDLYETLSIAVMKFCDNFPELHPLRNVHRRWLELAKKLKIENQSLMELLVQIIGTCNFGGREAILMAEEDKVEKLQSASSILDSVIANPPLKLSTLSSDKANTLIQWYMLNRTTETGQSPASDLMKSISENLLILFKMFHEDDNFVKICLRELLNLKKETEIIERLCKEVMVNSYTSISLNLRVCECFEQLMQVWMVTDALAHYFAFDMNGFDYIFGLIGKTPETKEHIAPSEEDAFLESLDILSQNKNKVEKKSEVGATNSNHLADFKEEELANKVKFIKQPNQTINTVTEDWSNHKKGNKSKILTCPMTGQYENEYPITIELDRTCEIKAIRLGILAPDVTTSMTQLCSTPSFILVEGGQELNNLEPLGELVLINDEGYSNLSVKTFVKNFQVIKSNKDIQKSIKSLSSLKVKFLKFTFGRPTVTFMEGISGQTNKPYKSLAFCISFLSISGYDIAKLPLNAEKRCNDICQKTALLVLSQLFNEVFISTINKLANQPSFVERVKSNFRDITQLMSQEGDLISSINYILGANNEDLGDWMIEYYLKHGVIETYAKLISQIVLSNASKIYPRLQLLLSRILESLTNADKLSRGYTDLTKLNQTSKFLETFSNSIDSSFRRVTPATKLVFKVQRQDIDNIIEVFDNSVGTKINSTLIQFMITLIYLKHPYSLSNDLTEYALTKIYNSCSESKMHFYGFIIALLVSTRCSDWLKQDNNLKVNMVIKDLYEALVNGKERMVKYQIGFLIQAALHLNKYLLSEHNLHIELYNRVKTMKFQSGEVFDLLIKLFKNIIMNNPGSEVALVEHLIKDLETLPRKRDPSFQKFYVDILGIEREINIVIKGLSSIPKQDFTIPSDLLSKAQKVALVKRIADKAKYSLMLSVDKDSDIWNKSHVPKLISNPPFLLLAQFGDESKTVICGAYCVSDPDASEYAINFNGNPKNFLFSFDDDSKGGIKENFINNAEEAKFCSFSQDEDYSVLEFFSNGDQVLSLSFSEECESFQKLLPDFKRLKLKKIEFWDLKHLRSQTSLNVSLEQATVPVSYYRSEPISIVPYQVTAKKLCEMIGVNTKFICDDQEVDKDQVIGELEHKTEDYIIDMEINLPSCQVAPINKKYMPEMVVYNEFNHQSGVNKLIDVGVEAIKTWNNENQRKRWGIFLEQLQMFNKIPGFFGLLIKHMDIFMLIVDVVAGLPDTTKSDRDWGQEEIKLRRFCYENIANTLKLVKTQEIRTLFVDNGLLETILIKLAMISKETVRKIVDDQEDTEEKAEDKTGGKTEELPGTVIVTKSSSKEEDRKRKKKGIGYGSDSVNNNNTKWNTNQFFENKKQLSEEILRISNILINYLDMPEPTNDPVLGDILKGSCVLPLIETALRSSSILEISKEFTLFSAYLELIRNIAKDPATISCLLPLEKKYKPVQGESILSLLQKLNKTVDIYLSCLQTTTEKSADTVETIGHDIASTYKFVQSAVEKMNIQTPEEQMGQILKLPLTEAYRRLLEPLRFDYVSMKENQIYKHHFQSTITNAIPPPVKTLRLSQELADLSSSLPCEHTNSIFVRCDKDRVDVIRALIMGSKDTPYSNGAFLFDIFCEDTYPNQPPKMVITTTGGAKIRFNPNLYSCGKVCLSLLGTWKGQVTENWDPKLSTLLQLLISTQSIIMNEDIYFNEPGYEGEQGTEEGDKKNEAYSNIVRLGNIRYAMIDQINNPPKGFEDVVRRHFFLKKKEVMEECQKWLVYAQKREASYVGLTYEHNMTLATEFKESKTKYFELLSKAVKDLEVALDSIEEPKFVETVKTIKIKRTKNEEDIKGERLEEIDMTYEKHEANKELNYEDEKVKDRWSRYIGAMGLEAVKKQSESQVVLIGLGTLGLEIAKNLVLSGLKRLTIVDNQVVRSHTEHFFLSDMPGELRYKCLFKLQELNRYVKIDHNKEVPDLGPYSLVVDTRTFSKEVFDLSSLCRKQDKKYISVESKGVCGRIFNDFGPSFEINDVNGEQPVEIIVKSISNEEKGVVTLPPGFKHPYEDGDYVVIELVDGMEDKEKQLADKSQQQLFYEKQTGSKANGINGRVFRIQVINSQSFYIGDTRDFAPYIRNGVVKNLKLPKVVDFKTLEECTKSVGALPFDQNMAIYDFDKMGDNSRIHAAFEVLGEFVAEHKRLPLNWDHADATNFVGKAKIKIEELIKGVPEEKRIEELKRQLEFFYEFSLVAESELPAIDAYLGGLASQEAIKAITNKFAPIQQLFTFHFRELLPEIPKTPSELQPLKIKPNEDFFNLKVILGRGAVEKLATSNVFVIGAGAIGCQLLKNFAMLNLCSSGTLTVTDPDHIETSNLNRQFLFREKHIRKPKSSTASAAIIQMNHALKGHIVAKLEKVCDVTEGIFSDKFFGSLTLVANALDNVQARLYVDRRCVSNKVALLESGTLGPKGHVQVIIPFKTESYGSQNDPVEENQIPHCTLKLFPEDTLHCIEWSRDLFGKAFTLKPKALKKLIDEVKNKTANVNDEGVDKVIKNANRAPKDFLDCIVSAVKKFYKYFRNDIRQLLHTYPLTLKTKDGEPFWKLPKRPPTEISQLDPKHELHRIFIASYAVNKAKVFGIPFPKNFRTEEGRNDIMRDAIKVKIPDFKPSEEGSKKINDLNTQEKIQVPEESEATVMTESENPSPSPSPSPLSIPKNITEIIALPEEFQKDDDSNGHIDLIYSMANLRSVNYSLAPYTWIQTKLKAGRIMPALSTTTSVVSALQSIELIKIIKGSKSPKNTFANLAVPLVQMSEPGAAPKTKIGNSEISVWDRWEVKANTLKELYQNLSETYDVQPVDSLVNGVVVYLKVTYKDKQKEEETLMNTGLRELLGLEKEDTWIDFTISFKDMKTGTQIHSVPAVRVLIP